MLRPTIVMSLVWLACIGVATGGRGAEDEAKDKIDPAAVKTFVAAASYLQSLDRFSATIHSKLHIEGIVGSNDIASSFTLAAEKPNRLAVRLTDGEMGATIISDGKHRITFLPRAKKYSQHEAEPTLAEMVANPLNLIVQKAHAGAFSGLFLLLQNPAELKKELMLAEDVGEEKLGDVPVDHLRIGAEEGRWDIWIEQGDKPWVRKIEPDLLYALRQNGQEPPEGIKLEAVATLDHWKADPQLTAETFRFDPPADAEEVDSVLRSRARPPSALLGKPAPDFVAKGLDGEPVRLADYKGKDVIVIEFWATWCGPCVELLPKVVKVTNEYKAKGVTYLAMDVGEDVDTVREFLKEKKLEVPVVFDFEGEIAAQYSGEGEPTALPLTVLVGKDGTVQAVHVGLSVDEDVAKRLRRELDTLLEGKPLSEKKAKPDPSDGDRPMIPAKSLK